MTCKDCLHYGVYYWQISVGMSALSNAIIDIPDVDKTCKGFKDKSRYVEQKHGEWLNLTGDWRIAECSSCGQFYTISHNGQSKKKWFDGFCKAHKYCPNCGAKMDGGKE